MLSGKNSNQLDIKEYRNIKDKNTVIEQSLKEEEKDKTKIAKKLPMEKTVDDTINNINLLLKNEVII